MAKLSLNAFTWVSIGVLLLASEPAKSQYLDITAYQSQAHNLIKTALDDKEGFGRLTFFVDTFGNRLSGSENLERSIKWITKELTREGFDDVRAQPVMVPHWVRGREKATLLLPRIQNLPILGLGGSIGTPKDGIEADVLVVNNFADLAQKSNLARDKIVLFDVPFATYSQTVRYRTDGAIEAAKVGAIASLVRSVTPFSMQTPHTGNMRYIDGVRKIPHAAITVEDAKMLHRMQRRGQPVRMRLSMEAKTLPDAPSHNIIAQVTGSEKPHEIIVIGGHIDSWDVGQGAMDDAGGCFVAWQALRLIKELNLKPRRTIRLVLWTNEENGVRGGRAYRDMVQKKRTLNNHILAIESDGGVFEPKGFGFTGSEKSYQMISSIAQLLDPIQSGTITRGGGGADIDPLMKSGNVPGMGLSVNSSEYFWYHHTEADTIDKLNREDFNKCVATMAVMAFVAADIPQSLPK